MTVFLLFSLFPQYRQWIGIEYIRIFGGFWLFLLTASLPLNHGVGVGETVRMLEREMGIEGYLA